MRFQNHQIRFQLDMDNETDQIEISCSIMKQITWYDSKWLAWLETCKILQVNKCNIVKRWLQIRTMGSDIMMKYDI
jgi:hypothetical protein